MFRDEPVNNLQADDLIKKLQRHADANLREIELLQGTLGYYYFVNTYQPPANADLISQKIDTLLQSLRAYQESCPEDRTGAHAFCVSLIKAQMKVLPHHHPFFQFYHHYHTDLKKYLEGRDQTNSLTPNNSPNKLKG